MASKKLARQGSNILQHCWLSCFLSAGDNCCHDPPSSLFFSRCFFAEAHNSRWIVDNWNHDHSPSLRFSVVFFLPEVRHCSGWASHDPSFHSFSVFIVEVFFSGSASQWLPWWLSRWRLARPSQVPRPSCVVLGNLTRHDLPSHNNTNLNHPVTTSHFPNSQNFPNLQKYKDKKVQMYKNTFHSVATNKPELL